MVYTAMVGMPSTQRAPYCQTCAEREKIRTSREQKEEKEKDHARRVEERLNQMPALLAEAGVNPREYGRARLVVTVQTQPAAEFLEAARTAGGYDPVRGLYLCGPTGTGKTYLACAVLSEFLADPRIKPESVRFDRADSLVTEIQDTYGGRGSARAIIRRRARARLWVLDDFGAEKTSPDVARVLTEILAERALWPTVVTSNLEPADMAKRNPDLARVVSRFGPAYFRVVRITGRDRRFDRAVA